ncbi:hypothetical protein ACFWOL_15465 [Streptomyces sp. NPDC058442]|uniref:hypothetical protein n=1 Tax=Streptomyces sp. NPDC058442 TaxID=3346503 RepID=UPI0036568AFE
MFGLITLRRHRAELLAARAENNRLRAERNTAIDERDAFKEAAKTAARIVDEAAQKQPALAVAAGRALVEGGHTGKQTPLTVQLYRFREQARALDARLAELEVINRRCTCGGTA